MFTPAIPRPCRPQNPVKCTVTPSLDLLGFSYYFYSLKRDLVYPTHSLNIIYKYINLHENN